MSTITCFCITLVYLTTYKTGDVDADATYKYNNQHDDDDHPEHIKNIALDDGLISVDEGKLRLAMLVSNKIDTNNDNYLDYTELASWIRHTEKTYMREDVGRQWSGYRLTGGDDSRLTWNQYREQNYNHVEQMKRKVRPNLRDSLIKSIKKLESREKRRWQAADVNQDGLLNKDEFYCFIHPHEFSHMRASIVEEVISDMDKDNDGRISLDEYASNSILTKEIDRSEEQREGVKNNALEMERKKFSLLDVNGDTFLDQNEIASSSHLVPSSMFLDHSNTEANHLLLECDSDKDGKLSMQEILESYEMFINSQVTDFGEALSSYNKQLHDEL